MPKKSNTTEFIQKAILLYGDKYTYENVEYIKGHSHVSITCKLHGDFLITPSNFLNGKGCKDCGRTTAASKRKRSYSDYIIKARQVHGYKFTYNENNSFRTKDDIEVTCPIHGTFIINADTHLKRDGCFDCNKEKIALERTLTKEEFVERAIQIHGDKYLYNKTIYTKMEDLVNVFCPKHGEFKQTAGNHLSGQGCANCAIGAGGYKNLQEGVFYILVCDNLTKVGITNRKVNKRLNEIKRHSEKPFRVFKTFKFTDGRIPQYLEQTSLKWLSSKYQACAEIFDGSTECFIDVEIDELLKIININTPKD